MDQNRQEYFLKVEGMTCRACEQRVADAARTVAGVSQARADQSLGQLVLELAADTVNPGRTLQEAAQAVQAAGYRASPMAGAAGRTPVALVLALGAGMVGLLLLANSLGWFNFIPRMDSSVGLGMLFVAGLLTSVHCVAMCGGIVLAQQGVGRSLQYHLGRILSYTILGGVVGALGSVLSVSPLAKGLLAGLAAVFMLVLGLRMLRILPRWAGPAWWRRARAAGQRLTARLVPPGLVTALRRRGSFFVGLLNGFMPCGPLQSMQLYALGTGSALLGAASMFLFSLGTVPLLFLFGAFAGLFNQKWRFYLVQASAILVLVFGLLMAGRALDLSGASGMIQTMAASLGIAGNGVADAGGPAFRLDQGNGAGGAGEVSAGKGGLAADGSVVARLEGGIQTVSFELQPGSYAPITVQKGVPVRWTINASADNLNGCNREISIPELNLSLPLAEGANVIEFTPERSGVISYTCWMGMISSRITVVDRLDGAGSAGAVGPAAAPGSATAGPALAGSGGAAAGGGLGAGGAAGGQPAGAGCSMGCCGQ